MSNHPISTHRFPFMRRLWKPAAVTGAGGAAAAIWFEEIMLFSAEILALIFLPIMAGVVYLLDIWIFKSCTPCRDDMKNTHETGANK